MNGSDHTTTRPHADAPIGIFDSGVGGLSVLRHIQKQMPHEQLLYFSDAHFAPYGERDDALLASRAGAIGDYFMARGVKAMVVACNTATAAGITALRSTWPDLIVVGVEPGLKPAAAQSRSGIVGVLATASTLASRRFLALRDEVSALFGTRFLLQPCIGLAAQIELGDFDAPATRALLRHYVLPLIDQGADTLVLGCTHYPLVLPQITALLNEQGSKASLVDTGEAVAQQLARRLQQCDLLRVGGPGMVAGVTSGEAHVLQHAFLRLLQQHVAVTHDPAGSLKV